MCSKAAPRDLLSGGVHSDTLYGGAGDDTLVPGENYAYAAHREVLYGAPATT